MMTPAWLDLAVAQETPKDAFYCCPCMLHATSKNGRWEVGREWEREGNLSSMGEAGDREGGIIGGVGPGGYTLGLRDTL
jgi:hypothetical protein